VQVHTQGKASMELNQQAWRGDTLLAEGRVRVGCVNAQTLRPQRLPDHLLPLLCR
jgi:acyl-CoA thioester hydrolase